MTNIASAYSMQQGSAIRRAIGWSTNLSLALAAVLVFVMALLGTADVLAQNLFHRPIPAANELLSALLPCAIFLALAAVERARSHIAVDVVYQMMPRRGRMLMSVLAGTMSVVFLAALLAGSWSMALDSFERAEEAVAAIRFPIWPAKIACAIAITLAFAASLVRLIFGADPTLAAARPAGSEH